MSLVGQVEATFAFIDLAGFTALTEAHGDLAAVDMLETFYRPTRRGVPGWRHEGGQTRRRRGDAGSARTRGIASPRRSG